EIAESDIELIEDEFAIDSQEEIFYVNFDGRRRPARWNNSRGRSFGRNRSYRSYNPSYSSNTRFQRPKRSIYPNTRDPVERRWGSDDVCPECVMPGHKKEDCHTVKKKLAYAEWLRDHPKASTNDKMEFAQRRRIEFKDWTPRPAPVKEETRSIMAVSAAEITDAAEAEDSVVQNNAYTYQYPRHL
ncbi:MAG: hypothetical protein GY941_16220, partial [Planctomycetes bacterium]|nr:hypothetical protein [Planctomycetota bacterium]